MKLRDHARRRRLCASWILASAAACALPPAASAGIIGCDGLHPAPGFKILLDDIVVSPAGATPDQRLEAAMGMLRVNLEAKAKAAQLDRAVSIACLRCQNRRPSGNGDFDNRVVDYLDDEGVVLEVWGKIIEDADDSAGLYAEVHYVVIPMRLESHGNPSDSGIFASNPNPSGLGPIPRLLSLFSQAEDLGAFSALSVGLKHRANRKYDLARASLCKAKLLLPKTLSSYNDLISYLDGVDKELLQAARQDAGYHGLLKHPDIEACDAAK